ncbi:MAG: hypothetical protein ACHP7H_00525 [Hyphomicrobiales bacterium]
MLDQLKAFWARLEVHWHAVYIALLTALPVLLDRLGYIDLTPVLQHVLPADYVPLVIGVMPFVLAFLKPLIHVTDVTKE